MGFIGLYRDNGKENGNYYSIKGYMFGFIVPLQYIEHGIAPISE